MEVKILIWSYRYKFFALTMAQVYAYKGIDSDGEDLDDMINEVLGEEIK